MAYCGVDKKVSSLNKRKLLWNSTDSESESKKTKCSYFTDDQPDEDYSQVASSAETEDWGDSDSDSEDSDDEIAEKDDLPLEKLQMEIINSILKGEDDGARQQMKGLALKMLKESSSYDVLERQPLYEACRGCIEHLKTLFFKAEALPAEKEFDEGVRIPRQVDNLLWLLDILMDRGMAVGFALTWGSQVLLSDAHRRVPPRYRFEVSLITARLIVAIGLGHLHETKYHKYSFLVEWLGPLCDDYEMLKASKHIDWDELEENLRIIIRSLPLPRQGRVLMAWSQRFLKYGKDHCPFNLQGMFETWWRTRQSADLPTTKQLQ